jgi:transposase-like protein
MKKSQNLSPVPGSGPDLSPGPSSDPANPGPPEGGRRPTEWGPGRKNSDFPDPEVNASPKRRYFSGAHKLRVLEEADRCKDGELAALLRREGIYSANLQQWRKQRQACTLSGLAPRKRGRKEKFLDPDNVKKLIAENKHLRKKLEQAELIIDLQKKIANILQIDQGEENL